jgi:hypothetical protein
MKRLTLGLCLSALIALAFSGTLLAAGGQDFTLVNKTGLTLHHVYISPSDEKSWGEDVMGKDTLDDGESVEIKFHRSEESCKWDLMVDDKDGNKVTWTGFDLCKITEITLSIKGGTPTATYK